VRSLVYFTILSIFSACSNQALEMTQSKADGSSLLTRQPSSEGVGSCADLLASNLRLGHSLKPSRWEKKALATSGKIDLDDYDTFLNSDEWTRVIEGGKRKTEQEYQMGLTILSILKKRYPSVSDQNLKERYRVMMHFCG
jgi:hypothetical protein